MSNKALRWALAAAFLFAPTFLVGSWVEAAKQRLATAEAAPGGEPEVAIAAAADEGYCNADLKRILRRVLLACGLAGSEARGCQPLEAKNVATMSGEDFNALFLPLAQRASIIQFEKDASELDPRDLEVLDRTFADQKGASYFFVVARSSPEGAVEHNRKLSQGRAGAVMDHLRQKFADPDLDKEVGLLWLGEEYAQLDESFCDWNRSGAREECEPEHINRSAFVAWIDCRL
jgi:outer membrane protein OmpA-like peptidoglycan-associated protein